MSLVNCPDCQKAFSGQAKACPNCGRPSAAWRLSASSQLNRASFALAGLALFFYFIAGSEMLAAIFLGMAVIASVVYHLRKAGAI